MHVTQEKACNMASTFINLPVEEAHVGSVRITDGVDQLAINADGSINVAVTGGGLTGITYQEALSVASGVPTTVCTFTAMSDIKLKAVQAAGTNIAMFSVKVNGFVIAKNYTNFGSAFGLEFDFKGGEELSIADVVTLEVLHNRPTLGDFNATIITQG